MNDLSSLFLLSYALLWAVVAVQSAVLIHQLRRRRSAPAERADPPAERTERTDQQAGQQAGQRAERPAGPAVGTAAPAFTATLPGADQPFESTELRGRPTLLAVVAAGCGTCATALPALRATARRTGHRLVSVCVGPQAGCERYGADDPDEAIVLSDARGQIVRTLGISSIPYVAALDANGVITAAGGSAVDDDTWEFADRAADGAAAAVPALAAHGAHSANGEREGVR